MPVPVYPALLHEAAFVGAYLPVLDNPLCSGLARYGLVVVGLGNNLPVYYLLLPCLSVFECYTVVLAYLKERSDSDTLAGT